MLLLDTLSRAHVHYVWEKVLKESLKRADKETWFARKLLRSFLFLVEKNPCPKCI